MIRSISYAVLAFAIGFLSSAGAALAVMPSPSISLLLFLCLIGGLVFAYLGFLLSQWMNKQGDKVLLRQEIVQQNKQGASWYVDASLFFVNISFVLFVGLVLIVSPAHEKTPLMSSFFSNAPGMGGFLMTVLLYTVILVLAVWVGLTYSMTQTLQGSQSPLKIALKEYGYFLILVGAAHWQFWDASTIFLTAVEGLPGFVLSFYIARKKLQISIPSPGI